MTGSGKDLSNSGKSDLLPKGEYELPVFVSSLSPFKLAPYPLYGVGEDGVPIISRYCGDPIPCLLFGVGEIVRSMNRGVRGGVGHCISFDIDGYLATIYRKTLTNQIPWKFKEAGFKGFSTLTSGGFFRIYPSLM